MTTSEFRQKETVFADKASKFRFKFGNNPFDPVLLRELYKNDNDYYADIEQLIRLGFMRKMHNNKIVIDTNPINRIGNIEQLQKAFQMTLNETREMLKEMDAIKVFIVQNSKKKLQSKDKGN